VRSHGPPDRGTGSSRARASGRWARGWHCGAAASAAPVPATRQGRPPGGSTGSPSASHCLSLPGSLPALQTSLAPAPGPSSAPCRRAAPSSWAGSARCSGSSESPGLEQPARQARDTPAGPAPTPQVTPGRRAPQIPEAGRGLSGGRFRPSGYNDRGGECLPLSSPPHPSSYRETHKHCAWVTVWQGCAAQVPAQVAPALTRAASPPQSPGESLCPGLPGAPRSLSTSAPGPCNPKLGAPRTGVRTKPWSPVLVPSPGLIIFPPMPQPGAPRAYPAPWPLEASRRRGCILLLLPPALPGWQAREAGAASPPHAASANFPTAPGRAEGTGRPALPPPPPCGSAPRRTAPEAARCPAAESPAPPAHSRAPSHLS
jgi:hypothetical protein